MINQQSEPIAAKKIEWEMLQIELYTQHLDEYAGLFSDLFAYVLIEDKPGWRQLRHSSYGDIMLFCPSQGDDSHCALPSSGEGGRGIEIVICVRELGDIRSGIVDRGLECSEVRYPPWGSAEFFFKLREGYLIRVKQPREFRS